MARVPGDFEDGTSLRSVLSMGHRGHGSAASMRGLGGDSDDSLDRESFDAAYAAPLEPQRAGYVYTAGYGGKYSSSGGDGAAEGLRRDGQRGRGHARRGVRGVDVVTMSPGALSSESGTPAMSGSDGGLRGSSAASAAGGQRTPNGRDLRWPGNRSPATPDYSYLYDDGEAGFDDDDSLTRPLSASRLPYFKGLSGGRGAVKPKAEPAGASMPRAGFLLLNAIFGSGVLGQAYAAQSSGLALYALIVVATAAAAGYAVHLLLVCCETARTTSYEHVGRVAFGDRGLWMVGGAILLQNMGAMTSYLDILGDLLPTLVHRLAGDAATASGWKTYLDRAWLLSAVTLFVIFPLVVPRRVDFLSGASGLSISIVVGVAVMIGVLAPGEVCHGGDDVCAINWATPNDHFFFALPTLAFSFMCHTTLLPVYTELRNRTATRMQKVTNYSLALAVVVYMLAGVAGYVAFRSRVQSDVLKSFAEALPNSSVVLAAQVAFSLSVMLTVPLINFPARKVIEMTVFAGKPFSWPRHVVLGTMTLGMALFAALKVPDIKNVFGAVGATTSVALIFVFPSTAYHCLHPGGWTTAPKRGPLAFVITGVALGAACLSGIVTSWFSDE